MLPDGSLLHRDVPLKVATIKALLGVLSDSFASGMRTRESDLLLKTGVVLSGYPFDVAVPTTNVS